MKREKNVILKSSEREKHKYLRSKCLSVATEWCACLNACFSSFLCVQKFQTKNNQKKKEKCGECTRLFPLVRSRSQLIRTDHKQLTKLQTSAIIFERFFFHCLSFCTKPHKVNVERSIFSSLSYGTNVKTVNRTYERKIKVEEESRKNTPNRRMKWQKWNDKSSEKRNDDSFKRIPA